MKIAIDLNDVVRDYSNNFLKTYIERYNKEFDLSEFTFWSNNMEAVFPFKNDFSYKRFVYEDYSFELFAKCPTCGRNLPTELRNWFSNILANLDVDEDVEVSFVSPMEFQASIGYTYFFISKLNVPIREVYLPLNSETIWDKCDVLVTADPVLIESRPDDKICVKINTEYNKDLETNFSFKSLSKFMESEDNIIKLIEHGI